LSSKLWSRVWELDLPHAHSKVLMGLCDSAHDVPGEPDLGIKCFPSIGMLSWKTGYDRRRVQRTLRDLTEWKVIIPKSFRVGKSPIEYEIHLENGKPKSPFRGFERTERRGGTGAAGRGGTGTAGEGRYGDRPAVPVPSAGTGAIRPAVPVPSAGRYGDRPIPYIPLNDPLLASPRIGVELKEGGNNNSAAQEYVDRVLKTFSEIHGAAPCPSDSQIAETWFASKVPVEVVEIALWEGAARHLMADSFQRSLNLAYFKPLVEEELKSQLPLATRQRYIDYLKHRFPAYVRMRTEGVKTETTNTEEVTLES
jgi:hypothetical protein